jgi:hypothetical protein
MRTLTTQAYSRDILNSPKAACHQVCASLIFAVSNVLCVVHFTPYHQIFLFRHSFSVTGSYVILMNLDNFMSLSVTVRQANSKSYFTQSRPRLLRIKSMSRLLDQITLELQ